MKIRTIRQRLLGGVASCIFGGAAFLALHGAARAETSCSVDLSSNWDEFHCVDSEQSATGAFTLGATLHPTSGLYITNYGDLDVHVAGGAIVASGNWERAIYLNAYSGTLTYISEGTAWSDGLDTNTVLVGDSIVAQTGTVIATGSGAAAISSQARNGSNFTTGGSTTMAGVGSFGILTRATNGDNVTNTGTVSATAGLTRGVLAVTYLGTSCGLNTINVTGNVVSGGTSIEGIGCGGVVVNVNADVSVSRTHEWRATIINSATTEATTTIGGDVYALTPGHSALEMHGASSVTLVANTGSLSGTINAYATTNAVTFEPGASWVTSGTSYFEGQNDILANAGTIQIDSGPAAFDGLELLVNSGAIDMLNSVIGDQLTVEGNYVGLDGATLLLDAGGNSADRLVINGSANGLTTVAANYVGAGVINSAGIMLVGTGSSIDGAFQLGSVSGSTSGLVDYRLIQQGDDYYLFALPNSVAFEPLLAAAVTGDMWHHSADAYNAYAMLRRPDLGSGRKPGVGLWTQLHGNSEKYGDVGTQAVFGMDVEIDSRVEADRKGSQFGIDYFANDRFVVGVTVGYQDMEVDHRSGISGISVSGYNLGLYSQYQSEAGFYAGLLGKIDWSDVHLTNAAFNLSDRDPDSRSLGLQGELGYLTSMGGIGFDFGAGISYVRTKIDGFSADGIDFDFEDGKSLRGRLGVRGELSGKLGLFADTRLFHEFGADQELRLMSGTEVDSVGVDGGKTWGRLEAGIGGRMKPGPSVSAWVDVGEVRGVGLKAGLRF